MRKRIALLLAALLLFGLTAACRGEKEEGRETGLFYEATGISPDAVLLTVDGREIPSWRYLYWLTYNCDFIHSSYERTGDTLDWSAPLSGGSLAEYAAQQALQSTALYATVENWAETYGISVTEADRRAMADDWTEKTEHYGGEEAYLAALADMGLERADAETMSADYYLYSHLYDLYRTAGSGLYPADGAVDRFGEEQGYLCVDNILISTADVPEGDTEALAQRRQRAESVFSQLNSSPDPAAGFAALADTYSDDPDRAQYPAGRTFLPGRGVLPAAVEEAAQSLEDGQWSGLIEAENGFYILLRKQPDEEVIAGDYFDSLLQKAAEEAEIKPEKAYQEIHTGEFYEKLTILRRAADS
jgi:hypothetical protein